MSYPDAPSLTPQRPSPWKALFRVITEPEATFREFGGRVPILPAYLTLMVIGLAVALIQMPLALQAAEETMLQSPAYTPEMATLGKVSGMVTLFLAALAGPWIAGVITAGLSIFFGQFQEERVTFGSYLGMVGYARMPLAVAQLLSGILVLVLGKQALNLNLSVAALAPEGTGLMLKTFLGTIGPFGIWYYIVLAIGFGALHRGKASRGVGLVATLYIGGTLLMLGLTALGSKFVPQM
ncbi:MAG TPA: YIP1 family protein [Symbiobacteriaceae bacterium]|nr:YIP1 family protein [Symbiobacteriaceae bacterium]